jgi:type IV secretory pathway VirJ component
MASLAPNIPFAGFDRRPRSVASRRPWPRRWQTLAMALPMLAALAMTAAIGVPAVIAGNAFQMLSAGDAAHKGVAAVFVSGDAGLKFGMGKPVTHALAARGLPLLAVSSPAAFGTRRTRAEVDAIVAAAIRRAIDTTGADRIILMGQSYGADMVSVAAPDLPEDLRRHIAAIVVVVPGETAFFRADPLGFSYRGKPDAEPAEGMRALRYAPVVCVQGQEEKDSLCPHLAGTPARVIALPGGHYLKHDDDRLIAAIVQSLQAIDPGLLR